MEFKRFVSYVYEYRHNEKLHNCGFVKVEVRQNMAKLVVHMYLPGKRDVECKIYGFVRKEDRLEGVLLGLGRVKNGNVDVRIHMNALRMGEGILTGQEPVSIDELAGVIVFGSDRSVYATVWDEDEIDVSRFQERVRKSVEEAVDLGEGVGEDVNKDEVHKSEEQELHVQEVQVQESLTQELEGEELSTDDSSEEDMDSYQNRVSEILNWDALQLICPLISPFEIPREGTYLRMEPKHLKHFARELWYLGSNSFLLHGYYNYRYLIVGREKDGIILGIPGTYYPREEQIAAMFGFPAFLPAQKNSKGNGRFGYWCRRM